MGSKRTRNHYPRLPEAVQNLLILYGLRAEPFKERSWSNGASVGWYFSVVPDKPAPEGSGGWAALFKLRASDSLDKWITCVRDAENRRVLVRNMTMDLETVQQRTFVWLDEYGDLHSLPRPKKR